MNTSQIKIKAIAATNKETFENWGGMQKFSNQAITDLADSAVGCAVLFNFNNEKRIGTVIAAKNDEGSLCIEVSIACPGPAIDWDGQRIVPGFTVEKDECKEENTSFKREIKKCKAFVFGLIPVETAVEPNLPNLEKL